MHYKAFLATTFLLGSIFSSAAFSEESDLRHTEITMQELTRNIHMLKGEGGNIGISTGEDGVFMIDDKFAPLSEKIAASIRTVTRKPVRFLLNTHHHFDHVGGNRRLGETGTVILAHENVRKRLSTKQFIAFFNKEQPATDRDGLPVVTFTKDIKLHLNGEDIEIIHMANAHTDGDAIVYFPKSNVIHTGDTYFAGMYPFLDTPAGGSLSGMIKAADKILELANEETQIIPGHGELSNKKELKAYRDMLVAVKERIQKLVNQKKTLEDVVTSAPTMEFDEVYGNGILSPAKFAQLVYIDLTHKR